MNRIHLFEFGDQAWLPNFFKKYLTDFLHFISNKTKDFEPIIPLLNKVLKSNKENQIIDLCSGSGGSLLYINKKLKRTIPNLQILLTDINPNIRAFDDLSSKYPNIDYIHTTIDIREANLNISGVRTIFRAFHHFKPNDALKIVENAVKNKYPIAIFEAQDRSLGSILTMVLSPFIVFLVTPFIKPLTYGRLFFTYILPIAPLIIAWDGLISSLRTYSVNEMEGLVYNLKEKDSFKWEINRLETKKGVILYLIGVPK